MKQRQEKISPSPSHTILGSTRYIFPSQSEVTTKDIYILKDGTIYAIKAITEIKTNMTSKEKEEDKA